MVNMENSEEVMQILERFTRLKQKEIPKELDDYLQYVAKTGDTVFKWSSLKYLFREKLLNVIKHFHDTTPRVDEIPQYPNVDPFNYESMKSSLLERLELFNAAPFTIQRLCELLIDPRKQYSRIDKFMRALEKNILVVSTIEPGRKRTESENGDSLDSAVNGDLSLDVNVDIDMENESLLNVESQNGNGNGTSAITTAPAPDSTSDSAATAEIRERPVTHTGDDDILPNPKKPKLDLDVEDAEALANAKAAPSATKVEEDTKVEAVSAESEKKIVKGGDVDMQELEENKENLNAVADEKKFVVETSVVAEKLMDDKKETDETNNKKTVEAGAVEEASEKLQSEEQEETEVDAAFKGESERQAVQVQNTVPNDEEKGVDKQEVEKEEKPISVESEGKDQNSKDDTLAKEGALTAEEDMKPKANALAKKDVLSVEDEQKPQESFAKESVLAVEDEKNPKECALAKEGVLPNEDEQINKESEPAKEVLSVKDEQKPQKALVKEVTNLDEVEQKAKECALAKERMVSDEEKQQAAEPIPEAVKSAAELEKPDETAAAVDGQKVDDKEVDSVVQAAPATGVVEDATKVGHKKDAINIPEAKISNLEDKSTVVAESTKKDLEEVNDKQLKESPTTEKIPNSSTPAAADKTENEPATADKVLTSISEANSSERAPTVAASKTLAIDTEATPSVDLAVTATTTTSTPTPTAAASTPPIVITPPTLALNDHPMEEHTDDIAVAEAASPTSLAAEVEEVTMAETSSGGSVATAMATDVTEPAKDEPAGMEVDDTSQEEAMDQ